MKKLLAGFVAALCLVVIAMPALAALDVTLGGQARVRGIFQNNFSDVMREDGTDERDDHNNFIDERVRLYLTVKASENLKLVSRFEMGDAVFGNGAGSVGADVVGIEIKSLYLDFNIPCTPVEVLAGIQGVALMNSWIVDEDFAALVAKVNTKPVGASFGYIADQHRSNDLGAFEGEGLGAYYNDSLNNIDSFYLSVDYAGGPLLANFVAYYQMGRDTAAGFDPHFYTNNPYRGTPIPTATEVFDQAITNIDDNNLIDLGLNLAYKVDWMSVYLTGVKNFGSVDYSVNGGEKESHDYKGWMVDAGANFFMGPWTFNVGGFYTTGPDMNDGAYSMTGDIDHFAYPVQTSKYFSEIIGGGILDNTAPYNSAPGEDDAMWRGYPSPTNLWTLTAGAAYQLPCKTKLSLSYWYFSTSEDVESGSNDATDTSLGHEVDFYVTQPIVDGLNLDLVAAYLFAGDALSEHDDDEDIYELGARLQWNF